MNASLSVIYGAKDAKENTVFEVKAGEGTLGVEKPFDQKQIHLPAGKIWVSRVNE